jgi:hypothetical protein
MRMEKEREREDVDNNIKVPWINTRYNGSMPLLSVSLYK